jgi:cardiolipin synthase (CMP-forming)
VEHPSAGRASGPGGAGSGQPAPGPLATLPNLVSLARLAVGLCFPWVPAGWRLPVVLAGALSDLVDGASGRLLGATSQLGRYLDPVADKVFAAGVVLTLLVEGALSAGEVVLLALRDLAVIAGVVWVLARGERDAFRRMAPTFLGKAATAIQFCFLLVLLAWPEWAPLAFWPAAALSGLAAGDYARAYLARRREGSELPPG